MSRNAFSNENGRFEEILLTMSTDLTKFVNREKNMHANLKVGSLLTRVKKTKKDDV
jgi:hypothetical protein